MTEGPFRGRGDDGEEPEGSCPLPAGGNGSHDVGQGAGNDRDAGGPGGPPEDGCGEEMPPDEGAEQGRRVGEYIYRHYLGSHSQDFEGKRH